MLEGSGLGSLRHRLLAELDRIPILDTHSHINPHAAAAKSLDDILGYHYYTELAHSAGMDKAPLEFETSATDRMRAISQYLPMLENTIQYSWLAEIARIFFDFELSDTSEPSTLSLHERVAARTASPGWERQVLVLTGVEKVFLTNDFDDRLEGFDRELYVPCLRTDDLVFRLGEPATLDRLRKSTNIDVGDVPTLRAALGLVFEHFSRCGARACAISLPPGFEPVPIGDTLADASLKSLRNGTASEPDATAVRYHVFWTMAEFCDQFRLPFDLMVGVNRNVYPNGVHQGQDLFDQRTSLIQFRVLFNRFPRVTFPVSVLSSSQNQELVAHAWLFPNVVTHGHWWYSNLPAYIEPDMRARLTAVPASKQIGYYSDAYKLEFILPKFNMYRRTLASVLSREFVHERGWSEERAVSLGRRVLRENSQRVFWGGSGEHGATCQETT